jgi:hypothetical protein
LKEIDPLAFDEALKGPQYQTKQDVMERKELDNKWEKLDKKIDSHHPGYIPPRIPFKTSELIRDYNSLYAKIYDKEKFIAV